MNAGTGDENSFSTLTLYNTADILTYSSNDNFSSC